VLATAFMSTNAQADAIRVLSQVLEADPERTAALRLRAQAYLANAQRDEARKDVGKIIEMLPDDYQATVMLAAIQAEENALDEAEASYLRAQDLGVKSGDEGLAARGCLALANFYEAGRKDQDRAEQQYERCLARYPTEPLALQLATRFYDLTGRPEKSTQLWQQAVEATPENLSFRMVLAERIAGSGEMDEALAILDDAAESQQTAIAWGMKADFQRRHGRPNEAAQSLERAVELAGGANDMLRFAQGDLYVELGRLDDAQRALDAIGEPTYKELLRGRILQAKGQPKAALEAFDAGIRRWPNNAGARYLAGIAARDSGERERATSELREAVRIDPGATDAALVLAAMQLEKGEYADAAQLASTVLQRRNPSSKEAFLIAARASAAAGQWDAARATLENMRRIEGSEPTVLVELAGIERAEKGPKAAAALLDASKLDWKRPENEEVLRALAGDLAAAGDVAGALARVDAALAADPGRSSLLEIRGAVLVQAQRPAEARAAFEKAVAADPKNAGALMGLASFEAASGNVSRAVSLYDEAASLGSADGSAAYGAAQLVLAQGNTEEAEKRLRAVVAQSPNNAGARNDLAWILASRGEDLDLALSLAEQARRTSPSPDVIDTLGYVQLKRGDAKAAIALFEEALGLRPADPTIRYHLGLALVQAGDTERAVGILREAIESGPFPDAEKARQEIARLQQQPQS
jgi:tetratricopeptide (TPR) repeat protein